MYNFGVPNANPCTKFDIKSGHKCYIAPYSRINYEHISSSYNRDVNSNLRETVKNNLENSVQPMG